MTSGGRSWPGSARFTSRDRTLTTGVSPMIRSGGGAADAPSIGFDRSEMWRFDCYLGGGGSNDILPLAPPGPTHATPHCPPTHSASRVPRPYASRSVNTPPASRTTTVSAAISRRVAVGLFRLPVEAKACPRSATQELSRRRWLRHIPINARTDRCSDRRSDNLPEARCEANYVRNSPTVFAKNTLPIPRAYGWRLAG